jgi:outer membrane protein OmpA-like peptidoglycan-associated protein
MKKLPLTITARSLSRLALLVAWLFLACRAHSAPSTAMIEELVESYPRSEVMEQSARTVRDHQLAIGQVRKIGGRWAPEEELRKAGELTRITLQLPDGHGPKEAFAYYRERFAGVDARAIYLCNERDCGSSSSWANDIFGVKQLYGLDQNQYYGIFEVVDAEDRLNYLVVYTVLRGNKRVYTHLEWLRTNEGSDAAVPPNPNAILEQLNAQGYYDVSGLRLDGQALVIRDEHLQALSQALRRNPRLSLYVVGHDYSRAPLDEQMQRSQQHAERLKGKLTEAGVNAERLQAHGVGGLVPARITAGATEKDFRIELVVPAGPM